MLEELRRQRQAGTVQSARRILAIGVVGGIYAVFGGLRAVAVSDTMQAGHISLPNGLGVDYPDDEGGMATSGVAPNELTWSELRDDFAGTPWHKHVPARVELLG